METFKTDYGKITLYKNETFIIQPFKNNSYWDIDNLLMLKKYINPNKNILEIGGHCGTSSIVYASFLNENSKVFVYEPQENLFNLLEFNIKQNKLQHKIIPYNKAVFCDNTTLTMNNIDLDGGGGIVQKRYNEESNMNCNFGGIGIGNGGEKVKAITMNEMKHENIGFIHCDAQGSENFIFSTGTDFIQKHKPVILFENKDYYGDYLYNLICKTYPEYSKHKDFNLEQFCMNKLMYSQIIRRFGNGIDDLLIP